MPKVRVNDIEVFYEDRGAGEPVILIMGLGGIGAAWGPQIPLFAREFRTIVPDLRGTGQTSVSETGYTVPQLAADVAGLLRALGAAPAHAVGISAGGAFAQWMALEHPDTVRSLTLASSWGKTDPYFHRLFEIRKRVMLDLGHALAVDLRTLFLHPPAYLREHWEEVREAEERLKTAPPDMAVTAKWMDMIIGHDVLSRLEDIRRPTAIVVGDRDAITPPYFSEELQRHIPGSVLRVIRDGGHLVHLEQPEAFFRIVRDFLAGC